MLLQLKTGYVEGYDEGQEPIIYLRCSAQDARDSGMAFVFTDGHGLAAFTTWFDNLDRLDEVDWNMVNQTYWSDKPADNDRKRRKQAEFLVRDSVPWPHIEEIGVYNEAARQRVMEILAQFPLRFHPPVSIRRDWYYY
jgi:ssDNA thymidine ADP-ribosyltransferase, DarT